MGRMISILKLAAYPVLDLPMGLVPGAEAEAEAADVKNAVDLEAKT